MLGYSLPWVPWDIGRLGEGVKGVHGNKSGAASQWEEQFQPSYQLLATPPPAESRYLWQVAEVFVLNGIVGAVQEFQEVARQEMECIGCGQLREEFLLLRLVVQDFCLWVAEEKKSRRFRRSLQLPQPSISPEP